MTANGILQLALYLIVLLALAKPLGRYMARVYQGQPGQGRVLGWLERGVYRLAGVRPEVEMGWKAYALAMLIFNFAGILVVYALQRLQAFLPLNPEGLPGVSPDSSFNTAVSFGTNTNWQGYGGETTLSYLTQMLGLTVQNFASAAAGMATLAAFGRGLARRSVTTIGNFWVDLTRTTLYVLRVDLAARQVFTNEEEVRLTAIEYRLLEMLVQHAGQVVTHRQLLDAVWGPGHAEQTEYLRVYMAHLRRKLEADPSRPRVFRTETGVGYRLLTDDVQKPRRPRSP